MKYSYYFSQGVYKIKLSSLVILPRLTFLLTKYSSYFSWLSESPRKVSKLFPKDTWPRLGCPKPLNLSIGRYAISLRRTREIVAQPTETQPVSKFSNADFLISTSLATGSNAPATSSSLTGTGSNGTNYPASTSRTAVIAIHKTGRRRLHREAVCRRRID